MHCYLVLKMSNSIQIFVQGLHTATMMFSANICSGPNCLQSLVQVTYKELSLFLHLGIKNRPTGEGIAESLTGGRSYFMEINQGF